MTKCEAESGVCQQCYGVMPATGSVVEIGDAVGRDERAGGTRCERGVDEPVAVGAGSGQGDEQIAVGDRPAVDRDAAHDGGVRALVEEGKKAPKVSRKDVDWSPSADRIAYAVRNEPPRKSAIWTIGASGENGQLVVEDDLPMCCSLPKFLARLALLLAVAALALPLAAAGDVTDYQLTKLAIEGDADPVDSRIGSRIGAYRLVERLGEGGMGAVYLGGPADDRVRQRGAVKLISGSMVHSSLVERLHREREILAHLDHPSIARLTDVGDDPEPHLCASLPDASDVPNVATADTSRDRTRGCRVPRNGGRCGSRRSVRERPRSRQ